jgi:hypothetical protein
MTSPPKKHGGPRPGSGPKPKGAGPRRKKATVAFTDAEAVTVQAVAPEATFTEAVRTAALIGARPEIATGEGGPFRPATPEHTRERDVLRGSSRKRKHRKSGEEGDNG